jgi:tetratricopeptide (TPR) repeat protein
MTTIETAKKLMADGWKAREKLDFELAEKFLTEAKTLFEHENDWYNVTECLNHLAYNEKLKAEQQVSKALAYNKEADSVSNAHNTKKAAVLRAQMSVETSAGLYEAGLAHAQEALKLTDTAQPRADILAHLALFQLRTAHLADAEKAILEAEKLFQEAPEQVQEPHKSIWWTKLLATKALIYFNKGNANEAKAIVETALEIANKNDLKARITELGNLKNSLFND